jgi:hypothetical protein
VQAITKMVRSALTLSTDQPPRDALFIHCGKFQAGAFGRPAILALVLIIAAVAVSLWLHILP